jgi:hypothetical protein
MEVKKYIGKVLKDGHLSLPKEVAKEKGKVYEVILLPITEPEIYSYAEELAKEKGFNSLTEEDLEKIIHQSRNIKCSV